MSSAGGRSMKATFFPSKDKTGDVGTAPVAMPSMSYDHITCADAPLSFAVVVRLQIPTAGVVPLVELIESNDIWWRRPVTVDGKDDKIIITTGRSRRIEAELSGIHRWCCAVAAHEINAPIDVDIG